ncbi:uncharacterized protein LOC131176333 [Hevea brasiliensis]|uniref:uncharacterized protein LOC131176333 n=1 Tax=Hevea brasiliensis TaxID=3981 RepID=UPI0025FE7E2E|nr:uncharacterized protein LOC131176333 [Hevea brasiliensis]
MWRACHNSLSTKANLFQRACSNSSTCPLCDCPEESLEHLLLFCSHAKATRFGSILGFHPNSNDFGSFRDWFHHLMDFFSQPVQRTIKHVCFICWSIWKARNAAIFQSSNPNPLQTFKQAQNALEEMQIITSSPILSLSTYQAQFSDRMRSWSPPAIDHVKLNTDASFEHKNAIAGFGLVMRNATGYLIDGCAISFPYSSPLTAEGFAVRAALHFAISRGLSSCTLESNSLQIIKLSSSPSLSVPWEV